MILEVKKNSSGKGFLVVVLRISFNKWYSSTQNWQYGRQNQRPKPSVGIRGLVVMAAIIYGHGNKCPQLRLTRVNVGQFTVIIIIIWAKETVTVHTVWGGKEAETIFGRRLRMSFPHLFLPFPWYVLCIMHLTAEKAPPPRLAPPVKLLF